jgi:hypothetical protein
MIIIINSIIALITIYTLLNPILLTLVIFCIISNFFVYKPEFVITLKKILFALPYILTIIFLHSFFYNTGRIHYLFDFFKFYKDGFNVGVEISLRLFIFMLYIFSQNFVKRKNDILFFIDKYFFNIKFIKRVLNIFFLSLFFIELFFLKYAIKEKQNNSIKGIFMNINNVFIEIENDIINAPLVKYSEIKKIHTKNKFMTKKICDYITFAVFAFSLIIHYIYLR